MKPIRFSILILYLWFSSATPQYFENSKKIKGRTEEMRKLMTWLLCHIPDFLGQRIQLRVWGLAFVFLFRLNKIGEWLRAAFLGPLSQARKHSQVLGINMWTCLGERYSAYHGDKLKSSKRQKRLSLHELCHISGAFTCGCNMTSSLH